jgi:hypothetical protein
MKDVVVGSVLLLGAMLFLLHKNLGYLSAWLLLITIVLKYGVRMHYTAAVLLSIGCVLAVIWISGTALRERFEDLNEEEKHEKKEKKVKEEDDPEPHMDMGSTILTAFKRMNPEQVAQMRGDTKELMETQQQLIETLGMLGPQVQQGAELIKTFQGMFGGNLSEVLKQ